MAGDEYVGGLFDNHARGMKGHPASSSSSAAGHKTGGGLFGNHGRGGMKGGGHKASAAAAGRTEGALSPGHKLLHKLPHTHTHAHHPHHTHTELHGIPKELQTEAVAAAAMLHAGPREQQMAEAAAMPLQRQADALQCQEVKAESAGCMMTEGSSEAQQADRPAAAAVSAEAAR